MEGDPCWWPRTTGNDQWRGQARGFIAAAGSRDERIATLEAERKVWIERVERSDELCADIGVAHDKLEAERTTALEREVSLGRERDALRAEVEKLKRQYQAEIANHHDTVSANWALAAVLKLIADERLEDGMTMQCLDQATDIARKVLAAHERAREARYEEPPAPKLDACEQCGGARGGVPGNEKVVNGVTVCDYCHAMTLKSMEATRLASEAMVRQATINMVIERLGGLVEGQPTAEHNLLQRIDALRRGEADLDPAAEEKWFEGWLEDNGAEIDGVVRYPSAGNVRLILRAFHADMLKRGEG